MKKGIDVSASQLELTADRLRGTGMMPRSIWSGYDLDFLARQLEADPATFRDSLRKQPDAEMIGTLRTCGIYDWTSGFFPGSLWYAYELTGDGKLLADAKEYTSLLNPVREYEDTHDLGFMIGCSYGNALRLAPADTIKDVIIETADNLRERFDERTGCIRSWDFGHWNFPVIIDNMMNLELLFNASKLTGDDSYAKVALTHAATTMKNHFRPDFTCWHVVSYNDDGTIEMRETFQGKSHDSSWARGQAWAVYGYTVCFRETGDSTWLDFAQKIADMIMESRPSTRLRETPPPLPSRLPQCSSSALMPKTDRNTLTTGRRFSKASQERDISPSRERMKASSSGIRQGHSTTGRKSTCRSTMRTTIISKVS